MALIANGELTLPEILCPLILQHDRIVAVDGGLRYCHQMGLRPHKIVGDFDSCPPEILIHYADIARTTLPTHKDETDLEVAIQEEIENGARKISLFGSWGLRLDHSLSNLFLLSRFPGCIFLETEIETVFAIHHSTTLRTHVGQTLSLLPLNGPVTGIYTQGLKWELCNGKMDQYFFGVSNVCLQNQVEIRISEGTLLCSLIKL